MTAHALEGDREKCLEAGMDEYISKPVRSQALAQIIEKIFADESPNQKTASAPVQEASPPVDLKRLYRIFDNDAEEVIKIINTYLTQMSENLEKLDKAIRAGNAGAVSLIAHNCAGTSAICGILTVVEPLRELERLGSANELADAVTYYTRVKKAFESVRTFLQENLQQAVA
jgi:two-component system, sensor histidine kinase and response regulator